MESLEKDHSYSGNPQQPVATAEEYAVPEVIVTRRLRDRELLRKRKAEAQEKDAYQEEKKSRSTRRGRGTKKARGQQQVLEQQPEPQLESQPEPEGPEEKQEQQVTKLEEKAETTPDFQVETSIPLLETGEPYSQREVPEAATAESAVFSVELEETPRAEEPEIPQSLENDHLEHQFFESF